MKLTYSFLDVDSKFIPNMLEKRINATQKKPFQLNLEQRERLSNLFLDDVEKLSNLCSSIKPELWI